MLSVGSEYDAIWEGSGGVGRGGVAWAVRCGGAPWGGAAQVRGWKGGGGRGRLRRLEAGDL